MNRVAGAIVPAHPFDGGVQFTCGACGNPTRTLTEGGTPEPGEVITAGCDGCGLVNKAVVRQSMLGRSRTELLLGWLEVLESLWPDARELGDLELPPGLEFVLDGKERL